MQQEQEQEVEKEVESMQRFGTTAGSGGPVTDKTSKRNGTKRNRPYEIIERGVEIGGVVVLHVNLIPDTQHNPGTGS